MGHGVSCMCWRDGGVDAGSRRAWTELRDEDDEDDEDEGPREVRVALVGDTGVGKTTLARCFTEGVDGEDEDGRRSSRNSSTIGVECYAREVRHGGRAYRVVVVDCGGRRKYEGLAQGFLARCDVALVAFDAGRGDTLDAAAAWVRTWKRSKYFADCPWVLLGLRCDGASADAGVDAHARAQQLAAAEGACCVLCASAYTGQNAETVFAETLRIAEDCRCRRNDVSCSPA